MAQFTGNPRSVYVGLDLSDRTAQACEVTGSGEVTQRYSVRLTESDLEKHFTGRETLTVALEAGTQSAWIGEYLEDLGHEVVVANPREVPLISKSRNKSDVIDAEKLAMLCAFNRRLLRPIQHRSRACRADLAQLRGRDALVGARTSLINTVRGVVKTFGGRILACTSRSFATKAREGVPEDLQDVLFPMLDMINELTKQVDAADKRITKLSEEKYPETQVLRQIKGVGPLTALAFVLVIEEARRFRKSRSVGAYVGLVPRESSSGDRNPELGITKAGDPMLRRLLIQCAHHILGRFGEDCDLRRWGESIASRPTRGAKKRAVAAVARKLAVLLHHLWVTGEVYDPLHNNKEESAA